MGSSRLSARAGYTLPVFACAAAIAALRWLQETLPHLPAVTVELINPAETVEIPIEAVARLGRYSALAMTRSDPGDNLDLTRHTPVWALVELSQITTSAPRPDAMGDPQDQGAEPSDGSQALAASQEGGDRLQLLGGEGIGIIAAEERPAIYAYARQVLEANLLPRLGTGDRLTVTLILPEGRSLAERTSNAAFGVVEGLSLLGTSGISQPLSAPGQLEAFRDTLRSHHTPRDGLVFCVGENGLSLAQQMGIVGDRLIKTANWVGPMLVEAGFQGVERVLLFGYHGKLLKLAAGIFHSHHHVADGRREVLTSFGAIAGLPPATLQALFDSPTAEAALTLLKALDAETGSAWVQAVYGAIAQEIDRRAANYIRIHSEATVTVGSVLFDRDRQVIIHSKIGSSILSEFC